MKLIFAANIAAIFIAALLPNILQFTAYVLGIYYPVYFLSWVFIVLCIYCFVLCIYCPALVRIMFFLGYCYLLHRGLGDMTFCS